MHSLAVLFIVSFAISFLLTPLVRNLCLRCGFVDQPAARKVHRSPTPRAGGIAIALSFLISYGILFAVGAKAGELVWSARGVIASLIPAAALIFLIGLADDFRGLTAMPKLILETLASVCVYVAGVQVTSIGGHPLNAWVSVLVTVFWLLACTNAVNLIDGLDGLAAGVGLFAAGTTLAVALTQHNIGLALAVVPLCGALAGFLRYNFNPASIFLGDSGSLFIGFLLGCFGILWSQKSATLLSMTAPLMVLALPLLDTILAIVRRILRKKSIFSADRGHIHHRLLDRGLKPRHAVLVLYACCALGAICSLGVMNSQLAEAAIILFCAFVWIGVQRLGYLELDNVGRMLNPRTFGRILRAQMHVHALEDNLATAETVDECWSAVRHASRQFGFSHLAMRLDHTFYEEDFGAAAGEPQIWTVRVPLSNSEFINLGHTCEDTVAPMMIGPLANALRRALVPKLPGFHKHVADDALVRIVKYGSAR